MNPKEQLQAVYDLLKDPAYWTQGAFARDARGRNLYSGRDPGATCWCIEGAVTHSVRAGNTAIQIFNALEEAAIAICPVMSQHINPITDLNDTTDHATVLACITKAMEIVDDHT